jgi:phosphate transport system substrate-binding protein
MRKSDAKSRLCFRFSLIFCLFLSLFSITFLTGCGRNANTVVIAGSTSVQPFAEVLAQEYMTLHPGVSIDVQGGGSAAGIMATQSGTTDIGMSSRNLQGSETSLWSIEIARDGIAIIVNPKNPLTGLTLQQVADIYDGKTTNWDQIGGKKGEIDVFTREDGSGTRSSFESLVMGTSQIMARAMVENSNGAIRQLVSDDPGAIGYISLGLVDNTVKALDLGGIVPSRANVVNGTYNLSRPFLFLTLKPPVGLVKDFIDFTMSAQGQQILYAQGLITPGYSP